MQADRELQIHSWWRWGNGIKIGWGWHTAWARWSGRWWQAGWWSTLPRWWWNQSRWRWTTSSPGVNQLEAELQEKLLSFPIPMRPKSVVRLINFSGRNLECNGLVWLSSKQKVLPLSVWGFHFLLVSRHEPVSRHDAFSNLRIIHLKQQTLLSILWVSLLGNSVAGTADLDKLLDIYSSLLRSRLYRRILGLLSGTSGQVALMLLSLGVGQVRGFIIVQS